MVNLQNREIVVESPVEIDKACDDIRKQLATIPWVSHPYHIAQRFYRKDSKSGKTFYYPETYVAVSTDSGDDNPKNPYHRLTPDIDYTGMFFFYVGDETNDYNTNESNFLTYPVSIIFSANLELIDEEKLKHSLFTQELIRDVRRILTENELRFDFRYKLTKVSRDLRTVYREFVLQDIEEYNRPPIQCFRFDLTITIKELCD